MAFSIDDSTLYNIFCIDLDTWIWIFFSGIKSFINFKTVHGINYIQNLCSFVKILTIFIQITIGLFNKKILFNFLNVIFTWHIICAKVMGVIEVRNDVSEVIDAFPMLNYAIAVMIKTTYAVYTLPQVY